MAILDNPMGALAVVDVLSGHRQIAPSGGLTALAQASDDDGDAPRHIGTINDWECNRDNPVLNENWEKCREWCRDQHPEKPCAVSCFYGSDGKGGCTLKTNCIECSEAPDVITESSSWLG